MNDWDRDGGWILHSLHGEGIQCRSWVLFLRSFVSPDVRSRIDSSSLRQSESFIHLLKLKVMYRFKVPDNVMCDQY